VQGELKGGICGIEPGVLTETITASRETLKKVFQRIMGVSSFDVIKRKACTGREPKVVAAIKYRRAIRFAYCRLEKV